VKNSSVVEDTFQVRREKVADIAGSTGFNVGQALFINPGNSTLFPIFSTIASAYEEYRINHLKFTYETEAYTASGNTVSAGIVCLVTNFDVADTTFPTLTSAENYVGSCKGPPYAPIIEHDVIEAHRVGKRGARRGRSENLPLNNYFVYSSANNASPSSTDAKFYDVGLFQLLTNNNPSTATIGELYVEYSFTMIRPKQPIALTSSVGTYYHLSSSTATAAKPYGNGDLSIVSQSAYAPAWLGFTLPTGTNLNMYTNGNPQFIGTYWLVQIVWTGSGSIAAVPTVSLGATNVSGQTLINYLSGDTLSSQGQFLAAGTSSSLVFMAKMGVPTSGSTPCTQFLLSGNTGMTTGTVDVWMQQVQYNVPTFESDPSTASIEKLRDEVRLLRDAFSALQLPDASPKLLRAEPMCSSASSDDEKEADLEKSVHIPRSMASRLSKVFSTKQ